ncbi:accessory Sec system protein Asp2 [Leuconostoc inhae]|uniref:accessory Sec system protein Asp2 n=1 Tax=Leuconostoc inhae TaxID=178001 RepID=UPI001C7D2075|nr:accessory Sec system protein Asp2 [Leuconostoc inhae]
MKKIKIINIGAVNLFLNHKREDISFQFISLKNVEDILNNDNGNLVFEKRIGKSDILPDYVLLNHLDFDINQSKKILEELFNNHAVDCDILYDTESVQDEVIVQQLQNSGAIGIKLGDPDEFASFLLHFFFGGQEGAKLSVGNKVSLLSETTKMNINGNTNTEFEDNFGHNFKQIYSWRYNYVFQENKVIEVWLEYEADHQVEVMLSLTRVSGDGQSVLKNVAIMGSELKQPYTIENFNPGEYLFCSLFVKGQGQIKVGQLHIRRSRSQFGTFFIGGKRIVSQNNKQEIMTYFHPGDRKPPLSVYFSGYRSAEGFEGNFMMKNMGTPYLLITDPRIEGGGFYMGEQDLETGIIQTIKHALDQLQFTNKDLILSGLSMGTYGAFYYASDLNPHAVIVGKPLVNIGNVAYNEHGIRPNGFPTSLDVLYNLTGGNSKDSKERLNKRFWDKFSNGDFTNTKFNIAFMKNDDYDPTAFYDLKDMFENTDVTILSKGFVGRHNDNSYGINKWFLRQYQNILEYDFERSGNNL